MIAVLNTNKRTNMCDIIYIIQLGWNEKPNFTQTNLPVCRCKQSNRKIRQRDDQMFINIYLKKWKRVPNHIHRLYKRGKLYTNVKLRLDTMRDYYVCPTNTEEKNLNYYLFIYLCFIFIVYVSILKFILFCILISCNKYGKL